MSEVTDFNSTIDWSKYSGGTTTAAPVNTTPTATTASGTSAGILGLLGSSAGTLASSYLDALGEKLAGVNTTATPAAAATTDAAASAAAATATTTTFDYKPLLIVGLVAVVGVGLVVALRR